MAERAGQRTGRWRGVPGHDTGDICRQIRVVLQLPARRDQLLDRRIVVQVRGHLLELLLLSLCQTLSLEPRAEHRAVLNSRLDGVQVSILKAGELVRVIFEELVGKTTQ